jgi:hypothetical protein
VKTPSPACDEIPSRTARVAPRGCEQRATCNIRVAGSGRGVRGGGPHGDGAHIGVDVWTRRSAVAHAASAGATL